MIVADTNLIAYFLIEGEHTETAERVFERDSEWIAPSLWRSELRNVLALTIRHGAVDLEQATRLMARAAVILDGREIGVDDEAVLRLVTESTCSAYDCEFVSLALATEVPLVTSDRRVVTAFPAVACSPAQFLAR